MAGRGYGPQSGWFPRLQGVVQGGTTGGASRAVFAAGVEGVTRTRGGHKKGKLPKGTGNLVGDWNTWKEESRSRRLATTFFKFRMFFMSSITPFNPFFIFFTCTASVKALQQSAREAQQLQATLAERHQEAVATVATDGWGGGGLVNHGGSLVVGWLVCFFFEECNFPWFFVELFEVWGWLIRNDWMICARV